MEIQSSVHDNYGNSDDNGSDGLQYFQGAWFLLIAIIGTFGNISTVITILNGLHKKHLGIKENFNSTTIFILNLAFIDFARCCTFTFLNSCSLFAFEWPFGSFVCSITAYMSGLTYYLDIMALNLIALSRCLGVVMNFKWIELTEKRRNSLFLITLSWLLSILLIIPKWTGFNVQWSYRLGTCEFFYDNNHKYKIFQVFITNVSILL